MWWDLASFACWSARRRGQWDDQPVQFQLHYGTWPRPIPLPGRPVLLLLRASLGPIDRGTAGVISLQRTSPHSGAGRTRPDRWQAGSRHDPCLPPTATLNPFQLLAVDGASAAGVRAMSWVTAWVQFSRQPEMVTLNCRGAGWYTPGCRTKMSLYSLHNFATRRTVRWESDSGHGAAHDSTGCCPFPSAVETMPTSYSRSRDFLHLVNAEPPAVVPAGGWSDRRNPFQNRCLCRQWPGTGRSC